MQNREAIEVKVTMNDDGIFEPLSFHWNERTFQIRELGRRWQSKEAEHILVMVEPINNVYELIRANDGRWYVKTGHDEDTIVRQD